MVAVTIGKRNYYSYHSNSYKEDKILHPKHASYTFHLPLIKLSWLDKYWAIKKCCNLKKAHFEKKHPRELPKWDSGLHSELEGSWFTCHWYTQQGHGNKPCCKAPGSGTDSALINIDMSEATSLSVTQNWPWSSQITDRQNNLHYMTAFFNFALKMETARYLDRLVWNNALLEVFNV